MSTIFLYNTLSREKEEFKPIKKGQIGLYTCGPTVYNYAHLGNLRTYLFEDFLKRVLLFNDYKVKHIMNITDVGHLTGDRDMGEDKLELGAKRENKTAWEIANFYLAAFKKDLENLNILAPSKWYKATETIREQIKLIKTLEKKGYTYKTSDGIYFNTVKFGGYTKLSHQDLKSLQEGARVEKNDEKRNLADFALWKFSPENEQRQMEWKSPWGIGFPGWHTECSAMSLKGLGKQLDIHCGGVDHINVHHTNEIAQSEAATGRKFFNYWLHGAFLIISGGKKMAKSEGNFLTLKSELLDRKISPLAFRLAALQVHYHKPMEYSAETILNADQALKSLYGRLEELGEKVGKINQKYRQRFITAINDDLNMPQALAITQQMLKDNTIKTEDRVATALDFDRVLALNFKEQLSWQAPQPVLTLAKTRDEARQVKDFSRADDLRVKIEGLGYKVADSSEGTRILRS